LMRPLGGILSDRIGAVRTLLCSYIAVAAAALMLAFQPALMPLGTIDFIVMAAGLGLGSGAVFALVSQTSDPSVVGSVTGFVGAAGGLGGFVPPLVMAAIHTFSGSYSVGILLLLLATLGAMAVTVSIARGARRAERAPAGQPAPTPRTARPAVPRPHPLPGGDLLTVDDHQVRQDGAARPGVDSPLFDALIGARKMFSRSERISEDSRETHRVGGRSGDSFYRERWSHDKVVRSTHGVNCTGSCSWKVYVKDGVITWESQETDYPSVGPDKPEYEPRGCPRGASFSWYTYSP